MASQGRNSSGLSPRVRGNHVHYPRCQEGGRSIPARAGEPGSPICIRAMPKVYPRACGGTRPVALSGLRDYGLSPRVRGNLILQCGKVLAGRSIPARAGEPGFYPRLQTVYPVYPRACGGTNGRPDSIYPLAGLSPRVRGNRQPAGGGRQGQGSIPARAGEPCTMRRSPLSAAVYPRACGGTAAWQVGHSTVRGLSPRVRGNHCGHGEILLLDGSIPARAGEPSPRARPRTSGRVYPRACGGTVPPLGRDMLVQGLSPRVRGNRAGENIFAGGIGSIPARAGEPFLAV